MSQGLDIERLNAIIASGQPDRDRQNSLNGLSTLGNSMANLDSTKALLDQVIADGNASTALLQVEADWHTNFRQKLLEWTYSGKDSIDALAQLIADMDDQAQLPPNLTLRIYSGGTIVPVDQDAPPPA